MKLPRPLLAVVLPALLLVSTARTAPANFTLYVANYLGYGGENTRYYTIEKYDSQGNASVFATNSSSSNPILNAPVSVAIDSSGNVYVDCTQDNTWIEEFDSLGDNPFHFVNNAGDGPNGMTFDTSGNLYVAEGFRGGVERFTHEGTASLYANITGAPVGLAFDAFGNLYVSENYYNTIWEIGTNGTLTEVAAPGNDPYGLAFDAGGNLYVSLFDNGEIMKYAAGANGVLNPDATVYASLGSSAGVTGLAFDDASNLYVAEYTADKIVKINPQMNVTVFSTNGLNGPAFMLWQGSAATTTDPANHYSYGANFGWADWHGTAANGANNGAVIGEYVCSGYIYSANAGWINLGSGSPANGIYYQNLSANDFGVNQDGLGNLRGYAYAANIGWINFENTGAPTVDMLTGKMSGYVWSANCGWMSLSNAYAYVQTDTISPGVLAPDGLPSAWLLTYFGTTNVNADADPTGKGMTIGQDYLAGTDPNEAGSVLTITGASFSSDGSTGTLTWNSVPTRYYYVEETLSLDPADWVENGVGLIAPTGSSTTSSITDTNAQDRFYRIQAVRPLIP